MQVDFIGFPFGEKCYSNYSLSDFMTLLLLFELINVSFVMMDFNESFVMMDFNVINFHFSWKR
jgi:hypothetical protein